MQNRQPLPQPVSNTRGFSWLRSVPAPLHRPVALIAVLAGVIGLLTLGAPFIGNWDAVSTLPLHTAMEVFVVVVSAMVFSIGWHSFDRKTPGHIIVLSSTFFAVALLNLGHLLSLPGMPDFVTLNSEAKSIDFDLAARGMVAAALLAVALLPWTSRVAIKARYALLTVCMMVAAAIYWIVLFGPDVIAPAYAVGSAQDAFSIKLEYVFIALYAFCAWLMYVRIARGYPYGAAYLFISASVMALSAQCVVLASDPTDGFSLLAHIYKLIAYCYLYRAIFVEAVHKPFQKLDLSELSLKESESKFKNLMECAPDAIVLIDCNGRVALMNARAEALFGIMRDEVIGSAAGALIPGLDVQGCRIDGKDDAGGVIRTSFEVSCQHRLGMAFPAEVNLGRWQGAEGEHIIAIVRDISERKQFETVLMDQVTHDALTGLPNRMLLVDSLRKEIAYANRTGRQFAVIFLNVDHFKTINDTFGHAQGDGLLMETVHRLAQEIQQDDMLARQGGDEFIILQHEISDVQESIALAERLLGRMREPFYVAGQEVFLSASLGISLFPFDEEAEDGLLRNADIAMHSAKKEGRNCYRFHASDMDERIRERMELEGYLRYAVERNELLLHYQPRICMSSGQMVGMEALVRWQHPVLGLVSPLRFIPVAEESGLIEQIGLWVLRTACAQVKRWQQQGLPPLRVSVNLSARQFQQQGLACGVQTTLEQCGLDAACLELEITESTVMHDTQAAIKTLCSLKKLGVTLSIDDFGTGYSSLSYLKLFPIDILKIDRSFVKDVIDDPNDAAITRAIVALAHSLDLSVVAEGVETLEQVNFLQACGCEEVQGYYFSRPVPADELALMLPRQKNMTMPGEPQVVIDIMHRRAHGKG